MSRSQDGTAPKRLECDTELGEGRNRGNDIAVEPEGRRIESHG